jgi:pimeloyl-ACP methyl ester carboxylesterase
MWALAGFGTAVLDELGIQSAHVLGASFGGAVAQQMAFSHPSRVRRLVLVSTSFGGFAVRGGGHLVLLDSAPEVGPVISSFLQDDRVARNAAEAWSAAS